MFGVLLAALGSLGDELSGSIGKWAVAAGRESIYTLGFIQNSATLAVFILLAIIQPGGFVFVAASLPFVAIRLILEITQAHLAILALVKSDRSTFSFLRSTAIPLVLIIDLTLGYSISNRQIMGIILILLALIIAFIKQEFSRTGAGLIIISAINAACTISLYKYNITHFNSVIAEQTIAYGGLTIYFFIGTFLKKQQNFSYNLFKPLFLIQSSTQVGAAILTSFAYKFAPAAIILSAIRASALVLAVISGKLYFGEEHILKKLILGVCLILGLLLLIR